MFVSVNASCRTISTGHYNAGTVHASWVVKIPHKYDAGGGSVEAFLVLIKKKNTNDYMSYERSYYSQKVMEKRFNSTWKVECLLFDVIMPLVSVSDEIQSDSHLVNTLAFCISYSAYTPVNSLLAIRTH